MHVRRLPIADPCDQDLSKMPRQGARLFCDRCEKNVTDLSSMTKAEAKWFLIQHAGQRMCVKYRANRQGQLQFRAPPPMRMGMMAVAALALSACAGYAEPGDLDSPVDGAMCEDVSGYTIPCADAPASDDGMQDGTADPPVPEPTTPTDTDGDAPAETVAAHDVLPLPRWLDPTPPSTGEGCPLPTVGDHGRELVGKPALDRGDTRRDRTRARRERRRAKRRARRRGNDDLVGRIAEF